jgi:hypothetical protein
VCINKYGWIAIMVETGLHTSVLVAKPAQVCTKHFINSLLGPFGYRLYVGIHLDSTRDHDALGTP